jgi:peptidoglycan/xylan/chitin deacetylase (PgdA/CDA1 family)
MHDIHPTTTAAVDSILKNLKKKGFEMVTVTELAAIKGKSMKKGHSYSRF